MVPKHPVTPCQLLHRTVRLLISDFVDPQSSEITLFGLHLLTFLLGDKVTWSCRSFPATRVTRSKACNEHVTQRCSVKQALHQNVFFFHNSHGNTMSRRFLSCVMLYLETCCALSCYEGTKWQKTLNEKFLRLATFGLGVWPAEHEYTVVECFIFFSFLAVASKPPEFDRTPTKKTVNAQDVITLQCRSKPPLIFPTVQDWRKDGKPLLAEDIANGRIVSNPGQLLIKSATREDSGNYTCTLVNSAGNITSNRSEVVVKGNMLL